MEKLNSKLNKAAYVKEIDDKYSQRFIALDPKGYFIIKLNQATQEIILEHFNNKVDKDGIAIDPETGLPLECNAKQKRHPTAIIKGKTAKEIGIKITEGNGPFPISKFDHALYVGRELQKAEYCLINGTTYIQD